MKHFPKLGALALVAALSLSAGCKKGNKNLTPLPGYSGNGSSPVVSAPITSGQPIIPPPPVVNTGGGIGTGRTFGPGDGGVTGTDLTGGKSTFTGVTTGQPDRETFDGMVADRDQFRGNTVYFDYDKSAIKGDQKPNVVVVSEYLKSHPESKLAVEGHCDERGTEEYNRALGERRALSVREMLLNLGVNSDRVVTRSFGEDKPAVDGHDDAAWSKNRRAEFVLLLPPGGLR
jgi:peptidoglycan-associated lipoprotein